MRFWLKYVEIGSLRKYITRCFPKAAGCFDRGAAFELQKVLAEKLPKAPKHRSSRFPQTSFNAFLLVGIMFFCIFLKLINPKLLPLMLEGEVLVVGIPFRIDLYPGYGFLKEIRARVPF